MKLLLSLIVTFAIVSLNGAHAQFTLQTSTPEDVAIAFYKKGGKIPNFDTWIIGQPPYNSTPWAMREKVLYDEKLRLVEKYQEYDPENGLIKIRVAVKIDFEAIPDAKDMNILHNIMIISYKNVGDESYYPYKFLDQYITVVPSNMKAYTSAALDDEEYEYIKNKLNKSRNPSAYIELKPSVTDHEAPHNIDGLDQWIMTADIVSYLIIDDSGSIIWEKTAPWYIAPQTRDLNNLYDGQYRVNKPE